jgi:GntR family transcriptional regulator
VKLKTNIWVTTQLDRHSSIPLYQQLSDFIAENIHKGDLKPGDPIPSENELISLFNVSRFVVRQTMNILGRQGLVVTQRGRGSFVTQPRISKPLGVLQSYHTGMKKAGIDVDVRITSKEVVIPPPEIAEKLSLKEGEKVLLLERVAYTNDTSLNLLLTYIAPGTWGIDRLLAFEGGSLYQFLANTCDIHMTYSQSNIEVIFASEYESRWLNLARGSVLLQITSVSFDKGGIPVEHNRVVYPGSLFSFQFESHITDPSGDKEPIHVSKG